MPTITRIEDARSQWQEAVERMQDASAALEAAPVDADEDEIRGLQAAFDASETEANRCKANVDRLERIHSARAEVLRTSETDGEERKDGDPERRTPIRVGREPLTYQRGGRYSFLGDMYAAQKGNGVAAERLKRHQFEMAVERRDISTSAGAGGDFIAPVYLGNLWLDVARAGRVVASLPNIQKLGAPPRADSFTIPRLSTSPDVAIQASDNAAIQETDAVTGLLTVGTSTIAGLQDVAQQLLDRSDPGLDEILFRALGLQYALKLNVQVLSGSGSSGQMTGILTQSGTTAVAYTDASPTQAEFLVTLYQAISQITTQRFLPPDCIVMHPRRWAWLLSAVDAQGRPLVIPLGAYAQYVPNADVEAENPTGIAGAVVAQGLAGYIAGLPVFIDPSIPTNLGAGTNQDPVLVLRSADLMLWEDPEPRPDTFREILSSTLTVRLRVYGYAAFTAGAYGKSVAVINGTGLVAPSGF